MSNNNISNDTDNVPVVAEEKKEEQHSKNNISFETYMKPLAIIAGLIAILVIVWVAWKYIMPRVSGRAEGGGWGKKRRASGGKWGARGGCACSAPPPS